MYAHRGPPHMLITSGKQFVVKFFDVFCAVLESKNYLTTAHHPQTNRQIEWPDKTTVQRLRYNVEKQHNERDVFLRPFKYAYSLPVSRSGEETLFDPVITRHSSGLEMTESLSKDEIPTWKKP